MSSTRRKRCPECGATVERIVWGMVTEDPGPGWVMGGCALPVGELPTVRCPECGWDDSSGLATAHA